MFVRIACLVLFAALITVPSAAQEPLGPGEGKPLVYPDFEGNIYSANPLLAFGARWNNLIWLMYPAFIWIDAYTGLPQPGAIGSLATGWTFSSDLRTLTITLRNDWTWSDGTPITSADIKYGYDAALSGEMDSPLNTWIEPIESLETPDPRTVVVTAKTPDCALLELVMNLPVVPAHHFREIYPTYADITVDSPYNFNPQVTAGPFKFGSFRSGEQITMFADQNYPDSPVGYVVPEAIIVKFVSDQLVAYEQFLDGQLTTMFVPEDRYQDARERAAAGEIGLFTRVDSGFGILLFNHADPSSPQPAFYEAGERIEQPPHPILGARDVRKAIAHAIDFEALNTAGLSGVGIPAAAMMLEQSWAHNSNIQPYPFDLALSRRLLDEAGWVDHDGNDETPRVATERVGTTAPGTLLELRLAVDVNYSTSLPVATLMQDQLKRAGIALSLEAVDGSTLAGMLSSQQYDMANFYWWQNQAQPEQMVDFVGSASDIPGVGSNWMSYVNPELDRILAEARVVPGCDRAERKALYDRAQEIMYDDVPFYIINTTHRLIAHKTHIENFDPRPFDEFWNVAALGVR